MESLKDELDRISRQLESLRKQIGWDDNHPVHEPFHQALRAVCDQFLHSATQEKQSLIHSIAHTIDQLHQLGEHLGEDARPYYVPHQGECLLRQRQLLQDALVRMQALETQRSTQLAGKRTQLERLAWQLGCDETLPHVPLDQPALSRNVLELYDDMIERQQEAVEELRSVINKQREQVAKLARPLGEKITPASSDSQLPLHQLQQQLEQSIHTLQSTTQVCQKQWDTLHTQMMDLWTAMEEDADASLATWFEPYQSTPLHTTVLEAAEQQVSELQASLRDNLIQLMEKHYT